MTKNHAIREPFTTVNYEQSTPGLDGEELLRRAVAKGQAGAARELVLGVVRTIDDDVLRASRLALLCGLLTHGLGSLARAVRPIRVRALVAVARHAPWEIGSPMFDRAEREAQGETDEARRALLTFRTIEGLFAIDKDRATRLVNKMVPGGPRVQALATMGRFDEALEAANQIENVEERDLALEFAMHLIVEADAEGVVKRGLVQKILSTKSRDRVLAEIVLKTKGLFLAQKISDGAIRAESLAKLGEWEEVDLVLAELPTGLTKVNALERVAAVARSGGNVVRANGFESLAAEGRLGLSPGQKADSLRLVATISNDLNKARQALVRAAEVDWSEEADRDARVRTARLCLKEPSGPRIREAIAVTVAQSDVYAEIFPDVLDLMAKAFVKRYPNAPENMLLGLEWAERCAMTIVSGRTDGPGGAVPPPLPDSVVEVISKRSWSGQTEKSEATERTPKFEVTDTPTVIKPISPTPIVLSNHSAQTPTASPPARESIPPVFGIESAPTSNIQSSGPIMMEEPEETTSIMRADQWEKLRFQARNQVSSPPSSGPKSSSPPSAPETAPRLSAALPIEALGDPNEIIHVDEGSPESSNSNLPAEPSRPREPTLRSALPLVDLPPDPDMTPAMSVNTVDRVTQDSQGRSTEEAAPPTTRNRRTSTVLIAVILLAAILAAATFYFLKVRGRSSAQSDSYFTIPEIGARAS